MSWVLLSCVLALLQVEAQPLPYDTGPAAAGAVYDLWAAHANSGAADESQVHLLRHAICACRGLWSACEAARMLLKHPLNVLCWARNGATEGHGWRSSSMALYCESPGSDTFM